MIMIFAGRPPSFSEDMRSNEIGKNTEVLFHLDAFKLEAQF